MTITEQGKQAQKEYRRQYNAGLSEDAKAARRAYKREWQRRNPEKTRTYQETYWNKKGAQMAEDQKQDTAAQVD